MGLFKSIGSAVGGIGKAVGGIFGLGGSGPAKHFTPDTAQFDADTNKLRKIRDTSPTELRKSTQLQKEQLAIDEQNALSESRDQGRGVFASAQQQQAINGGLGAGSNERLARNFTNEQAVNDQGLRSAFDAQSANLSANDFAAQEGLRDRALFEVPKFGLEKSNIATKAAANNANADAAAKASKGKALSGLFSAAGGIVGGIYGGPAGAAIGSKLGGAVGGGISK